MSRIRSTWLTLALAGFALRAHATVIDYQLVPLGGNSYQYIYTVQNDGSLGAGTSISEFDLLFDPTLYDESSLTLASPTTISGNWSEIFLASGLSVPAAYDALATSAGIGVGSGVTGFAVDFTWLGPGTPGAQPYEIYDPNSFVLLEQGTTVAVSAVPIPAALWLLASGIAALLAMSRTRAWPLAREGALRGRER